jgi:hypothetical protein
LREFEEIHKEFEEIESQGQAVEVTVNSKEEEDGCLDFLKEFGLLKVYSTPTSSSYFFTLTEVSHCPFIPSQHGQTLLTVTLHSAHLCSLTLKVEPIADDEQ